ncbi:MAG: sugar transferase [Sulfurimonas sp.]
MILLAYLAITKSIQDYSRAVIFFSFFFMAFLLPLSKNLGKKQLFRLGLWQRKARIYNDDPFLKKEILNNHYLGYTEAEKEEEVKTVFINSQNKETLSLKKTIHREMEDNHEIIFIPFINEYDLTHSHAYLLSNTRTNLIVFQNRLKSTSRIYLKKLTDLTMAALLLPLIIPILLLIAYRIRKEEPRSSILFKQERLGQNGKVFTCYKFRSMREDGDKVLDAYLKEHPEEIKNYEKYHKYENDPRITRTGHLLRKTSLDELPQIINVIKGEMSLIGPRPYMLNEKEKIGEKIDMVLAVKPGISGLWQVSGRSDVDFHSRVDMDVYYTRNWNLWMDIVILLKTIKIVLTREGAS